MLVIHAREIAKTPDAWKIMSMEVLGEDDNKVYQITGTIPGVKKSGKNAGKTNWRANPETDKTVYITIKDHASWIIEWSRKTGNCPSCGGDGKACFRVSSEKGAEYKKCGFCEGSGKNGGDL